MTNNALESLNFAKNILEQENNKKVLDWLLYNGFIELDLKAMKTMKNKSHVSNYDTQKNELTITFKNIDPIDCDKILTAINHNGYYTK